MKVAFKLNIYNTSVMSLTPYSSHIVIKWTVKQKWKLFSFCLTFLTTLVLLYIYVSVHACGVFYVDVHSLCCKHAVGITVQIFLQVIILHLSLYGPSLPFINNGCMCQRSLKQRHSVSSWFAERCRLILVTSVGHPYFLLGKWIGD